MPSEADGSDEDKAVDVDAETPAGSTFTIREEWNCRLCGRPCSRGRSVFGRRESRSRSWTLTRGDSAGWMTIRLLSGGGMPRFLKSRDGSMVNVDVADEEPFGVLPFY